jgi:hypothetical protein
LTPASPTNVSSRDNAVAATALSHPPVWAAASNCVVHAEEEFKVVKIDVKDLKKTIDPVSRLLDVVHMILHIDYASPELGDPHQRAMVHTYARRLFSGPRNPTALKAEMAKASS